MKVTKEKAWLIVENIRNEAKNNAKNNGCNEGIENLSYQIGWLSAQIASMLENGNNDTIERYNNKI